MEMSFSLKNCQYMEIITRRYTHLQLNPETKSAILSKNKKKQDFNHFKFKPHNRSIILSEDKYKVQSDNSSKKNDCYTKFVPLKLSISKLFYSYELQIHKYLIKNRNKFKFIASHLDYKETTINGKKGFIVYIEKGSNKFSFKEDQIITQFIYNKLISFGVPKIIDFIVHVTSGILELENSGLWHLDLSLRNIILVNQTFKIIDFDYAIKLKQIGDQRQIMAFTKKILTKFINDPNSLKYSINDANIDKLVKDLNKDQNIDQKYKKLLSKMCQLSKNHHRLSLKKCLNKIVDALRSYNQFQHHEKQIIYRIVQKFNSNLQLFLNTISQQRPKNKMSQISRINQRQQEQNKQAFFKQNSCNKDYQNQTSIQISVKGSIKSEISQQSKIFSFQFTQTKSASFTSSIIEDSIASSTMTL